MYRNQSASDEHANIWHKTFGTEAGGEGEWGVGGGYFRTLHETLRNCDNTSKCSTIRLMNN